MLTRRGRRRAVFIGTIGMVVVSVPLWVPRLLGSLPAFRVEHMQVTGARYVDPNEVVRLAGVDSTNSVWDDPAEWERRVEAHPLILDARIRRAGIRTLEMLVVEDRPVAFAATPVLVPVNEEGRVLPLDPSRAHLDLPILIGASEPRAGRLEDEPTLRLLAVLDELEAYSPDFIFNVSEVRWADGGWVEVTMLPNANAGRLLLPAGDPVAALRRIEMALGETEDTDVVTADGRFEGQVVLGFRQAGA